MVSENGSFRLGAYFDTSVFAAKGERPDEVSHVAECGKRLAISPVPEGKYNNNYKLFASSLPFHLKFKFGTRP